MYVREILMLDNMYIRGILMLDNIERGYISGLEDVHPYEYHHAIMRR